MNHKNRKSAGTKFIAVLNMFLGESNWRIQFVNVKHVNSGLTNVKKGRFPSMDIFINK